MDTGRRSEDLFRTISAPDRLIEQLEAFKEATNATQYPDILTGSLIEHHPQISQGICHYGTVASNEFESEY